MPAKALLPIVLSAKRKSWRMVDAHADESDKRYFLIRPQILERDDNTCGYCHFRALKFQEIHHKDDDHGNNKPANLITACCFCHMCHHLGLAGMRRAGIIIWCPEISQAEIANIVRAIFVAQANGGKHEQAATKLYGALASRATTVEQELGAGASNPAAIGQALLEMTEAQYNDRHIKLAGLRLLPKSGAFGVQIAHWQSDPAVFGSLPDVDWERLLPEEA